MLGKATTTIEMSSSSMNVVGQTATSVHLLLRVSPTGTSGPPPASPDKVAILNRHAICVPLGPYEPTRMYARENLRNTSCSGSRGTLAACPDCGGLPVRRTL